MQTIIGLISAEMGVALVPASLQNLQRVGVVYKSLQETTPQVETAVAWRSDRSSAVLREFLQVVRRYVNQGRNEPAVLG